MTAALVGYDPARADGVFTFGGTGTLLYGAKIGLEKAVPGVRRDGLRTPAVLVCSDARALRVPDRRQLARPRRGERRPGRRRPTTTRCASTSSAHVLRDVVGSGRAIACIVATMGTTDAFGLDDLAGDRAACATSWSRVRASTTCRTCTPTPSSAGRGACSTTTTSSDNPLGFRHRTVRALAGTARRIRHLGLADSLGIDFHKTGFAPYISSAVLLRDGRDFAPPDAPRRGHALPVPVGRPSSRPVHAGDDARGQRHRWRRWPTCGCSASTGCRRCSATWSRWRRTLREHLEGHAATTVLNGDNFGPVTLFRVYPDGVDTFSMPHQERTDPALPRDAARSTTTTTAASSS